LADRQPYATRSGAHGSWNCRPAWVFLATGFSTSSGHCRAQTATAASAAPGLPYRPIATEGASHPCALPFRFSSSSWPPAPLRTRASSPFSKPVWATGSHR